MLRWKDFNYAVKTQSFKTSINFPENLSWITWKLLNSIVITSTNLEIYYFMLKQYLEYVTTSILFSIYETDSPIDISQYLTNNSK